MMIDIGPRLNLYSQPMLKVKATDLVLYVKFNTKIWNNLCISDSLVDLFYNWYYNRYQSETQ